MTAALYFEGKYTALPYKTGRGIIKYTSIRRNMERWLFQ